MKSNYFKSELLSICSTLVELLGFDFEEDERNWRETKSRAVTAVDGVKKVLQRAQLNPENYALEIVSLYKQLTQKERYEVGFIDLIQVRTIAQICDDEFLDKTFQYIKTLRRVVQLYQQWEREEFSCHIDTLIRAGLVSDGFTMSPETMLSVHNLVHETKAFAVYEYQKGTAVLDYSDACLIYPKVGFSEDIVHWLKHLKKQSDFVQDRGGVFATLFGKLDEVHPIYSNWIITLHKGDSIWLITDKVNFDNPTQKNGRLQRRSAWRDAQQLWENCDLPYEFFHTLDEQQQSSTDVAKLESKEQAAFFSKDLSEFNDGHRAFLYFLLRDVVEFITNESVELKAILTAKEFIDIKLIEGETFSPIETNSMSSWGAANKKHYEELLAMIEAFDNSAPVQAIALKDYSLVKTSEKYNDSWLATPAQLQSFSEWLILEQARQAQQVMLDNLWKGNEHDHLQKLLQIANDNFMQVVERVMQAGIIRLRVNDYICKGFNNSETEEISIATVVFGEKESDNVYIDIGKNKWIKKGYGIGKDGWDAEPCKCCNRYESKCVKVIRVTHYKHLIWLLGLNDVKELPIWARAFRGGEYMLYKGNSLLNQTHPYTRLVDRFSNNRSNGYLINLYMCGFCFKKHAGGEKELIIDI